MPAPSPIDELRPETVQPPVKGWRELRLALAVLATLLSIGYANVVFGGRSVVYSNALNPMDIRVRAENNGPGFVPESAWISRNLMPFSNFHDPGGTWWQWEPAGEFLRHAWQRGEFPLWDPYVGAGAPALANLAATAFFPPYVAVLLLGGGTALKNLYFLALLLVAATASFAFLRRHGLSFPACLGGAIAVLFCGGLTQNVGSFIAQTAAMIPVSLLLTRWFLEFPTWRRAAGMAAGYAGIALSTFPPILVAAFGLSATYAGTFMFACRAERRIALRYGLGAVAGLLLVCFVYLPALAAADTPQIAKTYQGAGMEAVPWDAFLHLLSPTLAGGGKVLRDPPVIGTDRGLPYVGVVVLLLVSLARTHDRRGGSLLATFLSVAAVLIALKLMGVMPVHAIGFLPVFDRIHFSHYLGIPLDILLCLLAAFGLETLLRGGVSRARLALGAGSLAFIVAGLIFNFYRLDKETHPFAAQWMTRWIVLAVLLGAATLLSWLAGRRISGARAGAPWMVVGLLVLLAAEGISHTYLPRQQRWNVWQQPAPYVQELMRHRDRGRIYGSGVFPANAGSAFDLYQLDSMMPFNSPRVFEIYRQYAEPKAYLFLRQALLLPPEPVLDAANVGLVGIYTLRDAQIAEARRRGYESLWTDGNFELFGRITSPRYYFTSHYRIVPPGEAVNALSQARSTREILLEEVPASPSVPNEARDPEVVARMRRNGGTLSVHAPRPGFIYCSESAMPGWTARVNGKVVPILPANHAFRAIPIPAGPVTAELSYWPPGLSAGLLLALVGLVGIIAMASRREQRTATALELRPAASARRRRTLRWAAALVVLPLLGVEVARRYDFDTARRSLAKHEDPVRARPDAFYRVEWGHVTLPTALRAGDVVDVVVPIRNLASEAWLDPVSLDPVGRSGAGAIRLSYRWLAADGQPLQPYEKRVDLPRRLEPGRQTALTVAVRLPDEPGAYRLQFDLVHELVAWFELKGAASLVIPVTVEAAGP